MQKARLTQEQSKSDTSEAVALKHST